MKTFRILLIVVLLLCLQPAGSVLAATDSFHDSGSFDIDEDIWNECTGEYVHLTGSMMWINHGLVTKSGVVQWGFQNIYQNLSGVGLTSGIKYQGSGGEHGYGSAVEDPEHPYHYAAGGTSTIRLVAQGRAPNMLIQSRIRVTVSPDGSWHGYIESYESVCK